MCQSAKGYALSSNHGAGEDYLNTLALVVMLYMYHVVKKPISSTEVVNNASESVSKMSLCWNVNHLLGPLHSWTNSSVCHSSSHACV